MLLVQNALAKAFPERMHPRVDTWLKTWVSNSTPASLIFVTAPAAASNQPLLYATLSMAGVLGINAALLARQMRHRKEWSLPHNAWQAAVHKVEAKLSKFTHRPHIHRISALCDLSSVLKDMEMSRLAANARANKAAGRPLADPPHPDWMGSYTNGTISAALLLPDVLDRVHQHLGFGQDAIEQWVEASYLQRIYQDIPNPLPGTRDALVQLSNENPATMAFYFVRYPHIFENDEGTWTVRQTESEKATQWFSQTEWPSWVASTRQIHALLDPVPADKNPKNAQPPGPSPWEMYLLASQKHAPTSSSEPPMDSALFEMTEGTGPRI